MEQGNFRFEGQSFQDVADETYYYKYVDTERNETCTGRFIPDTDVQVERWVQDCWKSRMSEVLLRTQCILPVESGRMIITEEVVHNLAIEIGQRSMRRSEFALREVYEVLRACFDGIDALRNHGNHGNITASSVFLTPSSRWKLGNFNSSMSQTEVYRGYLHPDQLKGKKVEGWKVDLHALGVLIVHMCTLEQPEANSSAKPQNSYETIVIKIFEKQNSKALAKLLEGLLSVTRKKSEEENFTRLKQYLDALGQEASRFQQVPSPVPIPAPIPPQQPPQPTAPFPSQETNPQVLANGSQRPQWPYEERKHVQEANSFPSASITHPNIPSPQSSFFCPKCERSAFHTVDLTLAIVFICPHCFTLTRLR